MSDTPGRRRRLHFVTRAALGRLLVLGAVLVLTAVLAWYVMIRLPGESYEGPFEKLSPRERELEKQLRADVYRLAGEIGERHVGRYDALRRAAEHLVTVLGEAGYAVRRDAYTIQGRVVENLEVELRGRERPGEIVVVGAHYDSVPGCPGANDNGTGVAAVLALARRFADRPVRRTLRFVGFVNEEPPWFQTARMGSLVYARRIAERGDRVVAMLSLETMGCYHEEPGSQKYPAPLGSLYPSTGNFIGFVGNVSSRGLVRRTIGVFRERARFPSEGVAAPGWMTGVNWSDHWSFWQQGWPAVMVTDTAPFRYEHYHAPTDTPDRVRFDRLARVVEGLEAVVSDLVNDGAP